MPDTSSTRWDPSLYDVSHAFVYQRAADLIDLLDPKPGERVLDLGAGTGAMASELAARGCDVLGIDASAEMVTAARAKYPHVRFEVGDARTFEVDRPFDAVLSNATLHWVKPPEQAVARISQALRPGGPFAAEFGGAGNVAALTAAAVAALRELGHDEPQALVPWYFPRIGEYASLLEAHGFEVTLTTLFDRPTPLEGTDGLRNWYRMFGGAFLSAVPAGREAEFFDIVESHAHSGLHREGEWWADYRRLRVSAVCIG